MANPHPPQQQRRARRHSRLERHPIPTIPLNRGLLRATAHPRRLARVSKLVRAPTFAFAERTSEPRARAVLPERGSVE